MKKALSVLIAGLLAMTLFGCGEQPTDTSGAGESKTEAPSQETSITPTEETMNTTEEEIDGRVLEERFTEAPNYSLAADASTDEIRAMAVQAMYDLVTVPWYPKNPWQYQKSGVGAGKIWSYSDAYVYGGLPYTNGSSGLFHWLTLYDFRTGGLEDFDHELLNDTLGNSCYSAVTWSWASVTNDIRWGTTHEMTPANGCPLVGDYDIGQVVQSWKANPTPKICQDNGAQKMYEAYAKVLPADGMIYIPDGDGNHIRMACSEAVVVRNEDGTINGNESFICYHDQAMGQANTNGRVTVDGKERWLAGHVYTRLSFAEWFQSGYIPITMDVFTGAQAYEVPEVTTEGADACKTFSDFKNVRVHSVLRMAWMKLTAFDEDGKKAGELLHLINRQETETGKYCYDCKLSQIFKSTTLKQANLEKDKTYRFVIETQDAAGNTYTIFDQNVTF